MAELSFAVRASQVLEQIMERIESQDALEDVDVDLVDGVLKVEFDDGGQIIINRQEPLQQIWVASPLGPAHFGFDAGSGAWLDDRTGATLTETLEKAFAAKLGGEISLAG
ncbi:MAG: iron donor protein CyaY [Gammaproteobacteria bacterium]